MDQFNPNIIQHPAKNPTLILSVADHPTQLQAGGLKERCEFYTENFALNSDLNVITTDGNGPVTVGIFASRFTISGPTERCIGAVGKDGETAAEPNGQPGGTLELYLEDIHPSVVGKLRLNASGGKGLSPQPTLGSTDSHDGGNGGRGGDIRVVHFQRPNVLTKPTVDMLDTLADPGKKWPEDFKVNVHDFLELLQTESIKTALRGKFTIPESWKAVNSLLGGEKKAFKRQLRDLNWVLIEPSRNIAALLARSANTQGGTYGHGWKEGNNGESGKNGEVTVISSTDEAEDILQCQTVFLHPAQCRMLLEKARSFYFSGTDLDKARCANILQQLECRLQFLERVDPSSLANSPLRKAYRQAEKRLFIPSGPTGDEPISLQMLRRIQSEAKSALGNIYLGLDFYNHAKGDVPRASFDYYEKRAKESLQHLEALEKIYWLRSDSTENAAQKSKIIHDRAAASLSSISLKRTLRQAAIEDLPYIEFEVHEAEKSVEPARSTLMEEAEFIKIDLERHFGLPFQDVVGAFSQVLFTEGNPLMIAGQIGGLVHSGISELERDDGIKINKAYILRKLRKIGKTIKDLNEGYKAIGGSLTLNDPNGDKLILTMKELDDLLDEFSEILGKAGLEKVHKKFLAYKDAVLQRNKAILHYNAVLCTISKYTAQLKSLDLERKGLVDTDFTHVGADNPMMMAFLHHLYMDSLEGLQKWLHDAQRAYNFAALNYRNIIGDMLQGWVGGQYNSTILSKIYQSLKDGWDDHHQELGIPPQKFGAIQYPLDEDALERVTDSEKEGLILRFKVSHEEHAIFPRMADVRLTHVRLFLEGAVTKNNHLLVYLTHTGSETITDTMNKAFSFSHQSVNVLFKYDIATHKYHGDNTIDGDISSAMQDGYALIGPFTTWKIDLSAEDNPGLDLSKVTSGYFEFEGSCRGAH